MAHPPTRRFTGEFEEHTRADRSDRVISALNCGMDQSIVSRAEGFIWRNARLLERHRFAFHFKGGSRQAVIDALCAYQNPDGGFGNALEPDIRCPDSQPVPTQVALEILDAVGPDPDMLARLCAWLPTVTTAEGGIPWLLPSAHAYPRAPWWNAAEPLTASLNPTAAIAGLLYKLGVKNDWLTAVTDYCWRTIAAYDATDMHVMSCVLTFLEHAPDRTRAQHEFARLVQRMRESGLIADVQAEGYVRKPLDWAPTPRHPLRQYFDAADIRANLAIVASEQREDGGWEITFPPTSPGCHLEWRGWMTLANLLMLREND